MRTTLPYLIAFVAALLALPAGAAVPAGCTPTTNPANQGGPGVTKSPTTASVSTPGTGSDNGPGGGPSPDLAPEPAGLSMALIGAGLSGFVVLRGVRKRRCGARLALR